MYHDGVSGCSVLVMRKVVITNQVKHQQMVDICLKVLATRPQSESLGKNSEKNFKKSGCAKSEISRCKC